MDPSFPSIPAPTKAASVLTMEIVGYAALSAGRQHLLKQALRQALTPYEQILQDHRSHLRDIPTGAQMVFLSSPEHTCLFAISVLRSLETARAAPLKLEDIRMGLHFGMVYEATDMEMRACYLGEGIKTSVQMMEAAASGQALASAAFFAALEHIDGGTDGLFQPAVLLTPLGTGQVKAYPLSSSTTTFTLLERIVKNIPTCTPAAASAAPAARASELNKNIQTVQGWLTPVNVLVTFGTFLMTLIGRFTDQARAMTTIAVVLLIFGLILALLWLVQRMPAVRRLGVRYPQRLGALVTGATTSLVLTASGAMALAAWITTKDAASLAVPALASGVPTQTSNASLPVALPPASPESVVPAAAVPQAMPMAAAHPAAPKTAQQPESARQGATAEIRNRSISVSAVVSGESSDHPNTNGKTAAVRQVPVARRPAPKDAAPTPARVRPERCSLILQKASIDEPLSSQEKNFLSSACN